MPLRFSVAGLEKEAKAAAQVMEPFLSAGSRHQVQQTIYDLRNIAARSGEDFRWIVQADDPVRTSISYGEYMRGGGQLVVFGEMSFVWSLTPIRKAGDTRPAPTVELGGIASTQLRVLEGDPDSPDEASELAMWRMEVGDDASPGTHFHTQVLGHLEAPPFPKALDIPRLPGLLFSPFACLEFLISELFQDRWREQSARETGAMKQWRGVQSTRLARQLAWHQEAIEAGVGSPWMALKAAKPEPAMFVV